MKILNIVDYVVYPPTSGGMQRTYYFSKYLADLGNEVGLLMFTPFLFRVPTKRDDTKLKMIYKKSIIHEVIFLLSRIRLLPRFYSALFIKIHKSFLRTITNEYDIIVYHFPWFADVMDNSKSNCYLSTQNVEYDWFEKEILSYIFQRFHREYLLDLEKRAILNAQKVFCTSLGDKARLTELYNNKDKYMIIENGFEPHKVISKTEKCTIRKEYGLSENAIVCLFIGGNGHPNIVAAETILKMIVPNVDKQKYKFIIAGGCTEHLVNSKHPNVLIIRKYDDLSELFYISDIGLNPINMGSGTNIKILEYISSRLTVISTKFGMRGFHELEKYVSICDIKDFAQCIQSVQLNKRKKVDISAYSWLSRIKKLHKFLKNETKKDTTHR